MKILITGGHITPALALIEELQKNSDLEIIFVGRQYANTNEKNNTFEYQTINNLKIKFINLETGRFVRVLDKNLFINIKLFFNGFVNSFKTLNSEKPNIIFSFGGYVALPIALAGFLKKITIYTHEQTLIPGLANRIIGYFSKIVFVSFPDTVRYFNINKTTISGNLIRSNIFKPTGGFKIKTDRKILYITGGSLGAHSVNLHIENILERLLAKYYVIHQVGNISEFSDFERLSKISNQNYLVKEHFFENELADIFSKCSLVVSRSGANTVFELIALRKPSVLIPLPWSANGEQQAQANLLNKFGTAEIFDQNENSDKLYFLIEEAMNNLDKYKTGFTELSTIYKKDAANKIVSEIIPSSL